MIRAAALLLAFAISTCANAVELGLSTVVSAPIDNTPDRKHFFVELSGAFVAGDEVKLQTALHDFGFRPTTSCEDAACDGDLLTLLLNSPGGSFPAAIEMAEQIAGFLDVDTEVMPTASCVSACAILFMAGRPRTLYPGGRLGFHAPYIVLPKDNASYSADEVLNAYDASTDAIASLTSLAAKIDLQNGLISEMLRRRPEELYLIDNVDRAGLWRIQVGGISRPKLTSKQLAYACLNARAWTKGALAEQFADRVIGGMGLSDYPTNPTIDLIAQYWVDHQMIDRIETRDDGETIYRALIPVQDIGEGTFELCRLAIRTTDESIFCRYAFAVEDPDFAVGQIDATNLIEPCDSKLFLSPTVSTLTSLDQTKPPHLSDAPRMTIFEGRDMGGGDLKSIHNSSLDQCQRECERSDACRAFTFDRWNDLCFLKSSVGKLRREPKSITGVSRSELALEDTRPTTIQRRRAKRFDDRPYRENSLSSFQQCAQFCLEEEACEAFNFHSKSGLCSLIALPNEYLSNPDFDVGIKIQPP